LAAQQRSPHVLDLLSSDERDVRHHRHPDLVVCPASLRTLLASPPARSILRQSVDE
jgi:hypothetical protein